MYKNDIFLSWVWQLLIRSGQLHCCAPLLIINSTPLYIVQRQANKLTYDKQMGMSVKGSKRTCLCSPTTHEGSFRCSIHRARQKFRSITSTTKASIRKLDPNNASKASLLKAFLFEIINPSRHDLHRQRQFRPRPTRFRNSDP